MAASSATIHGHSGNELDSVSVTGLVMAAGCDCVKVAGANVAGRPLDGVGGGIAKPLDAVLVSAERC